MISIQQIFTFYVENMDCFKTLNDHVDRYAFSMFSIISEVLRYLAWVWIYYFAEERLVNSQMRF